ncbi:HAD-IA family hydrolase [Candidatus Methylacidithermus pantelleriae]|uniref:HAD-IA family hydrolase n=1 Tax=Candidatus Methylacidithermus pantelleriae TaxID=2744239 RepID=UPI001F4752DB|nr:HAD-IA family hydrolase [Candidatus Methylacidithermus pantelleriae]
MMPLKLKGIFFDAVGTLIRPARPIGHTYARVAHHYGVYLEPKQVEKAFQEVFARMQWRPSASVPQDGEDRTWWREVVFGVLENFSVGPAFPFESYFAELYELFARPDQWRVFPEVPEVLSLLREIYPLWVLSNWDDRLAPVLEGLGLLRVFSHVWVSSRLGAAKPDPEFYRRALKKVHCEPHEVMLVGDDPHGDVEVPKGLGWQTFWIRRPERDLWDLVDFLRTACQEQGI